MVRGNSPADLTKFCCGDEDLDDFFIHDAYNRPAVLNFYEKNGFKYLYLSEEEEREIFNIEKGEPLNSRMMYFDLIQLTNS